MAYIPINWQTGDTITAEKMNKMDNGWGIQESQLFSESVTTTAQGGRNSGALSCSTLIDSASIVVTFNGTDYTCPRIEAFGDYFYGGIGQYGPDFSEYPFAIDSSAERGNMIFTQTAGTFTVTAAGSDMQVSTDFGSAVNTCVVPQVVVATKNVTTWQAVYDAVSSGKIVCIVDDEANYKTMLFVASVGIDSGGNYHIEALAALNSAAGVANYYADTANSPIYPN